MSDTSSLPVLCLLGPTASGKTAIATELIERYPLEIISVDSAQVYKHMNIGTAKPTAAELQLAPHALIDMVEPWEHYSVGKFLKDADAEIKKIHARKKIPLLAGGTMLYFQSLWHGLSNLPESDPVVRERLVAYAEQHGPGALYERLQQVDPVIAERIHSNDPQRIMRALEVFDIAGVTLSSLQNQRATTQRYNFYSIGLFPEDRKLLHARIAQRFDKMLEIGFEAEVQALKERPEMHSELPSMRCVGYRQMWQYLAGQCDKTHMTNASLAATRQLAKRQITWLRGMENCQMLDPFSESVMLEDNALVSWINNALSEFT